MLTSKRFESQRQGQAYVSSTSRTFQGLLLTHCFISIITLVYVKYTCRLHKTTELKVDDTQKKKCPFFETILIILLLRNFSELSFFYVFAFK